jgi:16S rRNA (guanine527-N7)-methyltransferase
MEEILKKYALLDYLNVSRETCIDFDTFISMIIKKNSEINIISKKMIKNQDIRERHIIDTAQALDFIDLNTSTTTDLGTGGGMPGIVMAIMIKNLKKDIKIKLYEKSHHKSSFLREVSRKLNLDTEVIQKDVFQIKELNPGTIMARAFKPMPVILDLVCKNFDNYKNLILFMGKNGKQVLKDSLIDWSFEYTKKESVTSEDSFLLNIKNIKKRKMN